ncbi:MAG: hypothetical protein OXQ31_06760, partial [Spirochaetaceae bacterium]|nr:hypothetical protein [Spirochaetaceae bacterium]
MSGLLRDGLLVGLGGFFGGRGALPGDRLAAGARRLVAVRHPDLAEGALRAGVTVEQLVEPARIDRPLPPCYRFSCIFSNYSAGADGLRQVGIMGR